MPELSARRHAPATERNREPLLAVLQAALPPTGTVLEIASGTGQHAVFFAPRLAPRFWLPSDIDPDALASIAAWRSLHPCGQLLEPIELDVLAPAWPPEIRPPRPAISAILAVNLIHIAPWPACLGLLAGAARILPPEGALVMYGPFMRKGQPPVASNAAFDAGLRSRNPAWGVRQLEAVSKAAESFGFNLTDIVEMPANNLTVCFSPDRRDSSNRPPP